MRTDEGNEELFAAAEFQLAVIIFRENIMNVWNSKVGSGKQNAAPPLGSADEFFLLHKFRGGEWWEQVEEDNDDDDSSGERMGNVCKVRMLFLQIKNTLRCCRFRAKFCVSGSIISHSPRESEREV